MRNNSLLSAIVGAEEFEGDAPDNVVLPETVEEIAVQAAAEEVADVTAEVQEQGQDVEQLADEVEELQEQVDELQEAVTGAEALLGAGQFNATAFHIMYNRTQQLNEVLGGESMNVLGAEDLGDATTAQLAARAGLESAGETLKKWGSQAVAFVKRIWDFLVNFVKGLFNRADALRTLSKKVHALLDAKDVKAKEEIKLGRWNSYLDVEKKGAPVSSAAFSAVVKGAGDLSASCEGLIKDPKATGPVETAVHGLIEAVQKLANEAQGPRKASKGDTVSIVGARAGVRIAAQFFGGKIEKPEDVAKAAKSVRLSFKTGVDGVKTSGSVKNPVTVEQAKTYAKFADAYIESTRNSKVDAKFSAANRDRVIGTLKALDGKEDAAKAVGIVKSAYATASAIVSVTTRETLNVAEAYLQAARAAV